MAHMEPLPLDSVPEDIQERFTHYKKTRGFTPNSIQTMVRRPNIVRAFMQMNQVVLYEGTVSEELKMLVSLIASQAAGCRYCQAHTIRAAERYGSSKERMLEIWNFEDSAHFSEREKSALAFAIAASKVPQAVTPNLEQNLKTHWSDDEIVEIMGVVALFGYLNRWNDVMATPLENDAALSAKELLASWDRGRH